MGQVPVRKKCLGCPKKFLVTAETEHEDYCATCRGENDRAVRPQEAPRRDHYNVGRFGRRGRYTPS